VRPGRGVVVKAKRPKQIDNVCDDLGDGTDEARPTYIIPKGDLITLGGLYQYVVSLAASGHRFVTNTWCANGKLFVYAYARTPRS
jgi:hypothetical protein